MKSERAVLLSIGLVAVLLAVATLLIYTNSSSETQSKINQDVAKLLVQAIAIIIVGALVKFSVEQMSASRDRERAIIERKKEILRSIRQVHHVVLTVPFLIEHEKSLQCYQQNMSKLIDTIGKLKEISDDIRYMRIPSITDDVRSEHIGTMIKFLNGITLEGAQQDLTVWQEIQTLPEYSKYRSAVLKLNKDGNYRYFETNYDKHYEKMKDLLREELGI